MTGNTTAPPRVSETRRDETSRIHRSRTNRVFAGVCGGIAEHFGSDPTAVRLLTLLVGLFTGIVPMVVLYLIAAIIVPEAGSEPETSRTAVAEPGQAALVVGVLLIVAGVAAFASQWLQVNWDQLWPLLLIGMGGLLVLVAARRR